MRSNKIKKRRQHWHRQPTGREESFIIDKIVRRLDGQSQLIANDQCRLEVAILVSGTTLFR